MNSDLSVYNDRNIQALDTCTIPLYHQLMARCIIQNSTLPTTMAVCYSFAKDPSYAAGTATPGLIKHPLKGAFLISSECHFKSGKNLKDELVAPKDKDHITKKSGIIYRFKCDRLECDEEYIAET